MKYAYEDLSSEQFEILVVLICQRLLGISVQPFAKGPDGGRDAKFVGTAELHPSKSAPWSGTSIIQAKHTNGYNRSFSETDFHNPASANTVVGKELPRIVKLREAKGLDHYMLFANRKLSGNAETALRKYISEKTGIPEGSIYLCGLEQLELFLKNFPDIPSLAKLDPVDSPLIVSPDELALVVQALAENKAAVSAVIDAPPAARVPYEDKNKINNMSASYAKEARKRYLKETSQIGSFLAAPENAEILKSYESVVEEFQMKIIAKRQAYQSFDAVMEYLADLLFGRDPILSMQAHKRLTRAVLFYMYWNCDIGEVEDAAPI